MFICQNINSWIEIVVLSRGIQYIESLVEKLSGFYEAYEKDATVV